MKYKRKNEKCKPVNDLHKVKTDVEQDFSFDRDVGDVVIFVGCCSKNKMDLINY